MPEFLLQLIACYFCYASAVFCYLLLLTEAFWVTLFRQFCGRGLGGKEEGRFAYVRDLTCGRLLHEVRQIFVF